MFSLVLLAAALLGFAVMARVLMVWRKHPSNLLLFTVIALGGVALQTLLAGLGRQLGAGAELRDWYAIPSLISVFAVPFTLFTHATLCRRIGFAWARIDWGHGTLCLIAVALLINGLREVPVLRLLQPGCWQDVVWYQHAVATDLLCAGADAGAALSLPPLALLVAMAAWAGLGLGMRQQRPGYAAAMTVAIGLLALAPLIDAWVGPLAWFVGQLLGFAAIAVLSADFALLLATRPAEDADESA